MIDLIASVITGFLLGTNGYTWEQGIFWAVLIPVCIIGAVVDRALKNG